MCWFTQNSSVLGVREKGYGWKSRLLNWIQNVVSLFQYDELFEGFLHIGVAWIAKLEIHTIVSTQYNQVSQIGLGLIVFDRARDLGESLNFWFNFVEKIKKGFLRVLFIIFQAGAEIELYIAQSGFEAVLQKEDFGLEVVFRQGRVFFFHFFYEAVENNVDEAIQLFLKFFELLVVFSSLLNLA